MMSWWAEIELYYVVHGWIRTSIYIILNTHTHNTHSDTSVELRDDHFKKQQRKVLFIKTFYCEEREEHGRTILYL